MNLIEAAGIRVTARERVILDGVSFSAKAGERIAVIGPNGAGKSTLLKVLAGLIAADGTVKLDGRAIPGIPLRERARLAAYLPQAPALHWPLSVEAAVLLGRAPQGFAGTASAADLEALGSALKRAGLEEFSGRKVDTLSGGEKARAAFARFLASEAPVMLADEPVTALDAKHQLMILRSLADLTRAGRIVIAVLHDLTLARRWAERVILMEKGRIAADGTPAAVMTAERLEQAFGTAFLARGSVIALAGDPAGG